MNISCLCFLVRVDVSHIEDEIGLGCAHLCCLQYFIQSLIGINHIGNLAEIQDIKQLQHVPNELLAVKLHGCRASELEDDALVLEEMQELTILTLFSHCSKDPGEYLDIFIMNAAKSLCKCR